MKEQLEKIRQEALDALSKASDTNELDALRVRFPRGHCLPPDP